MGYTRNDGTVGMYKTVAASQTDQVLGANGINSAGAITTGNGSKGDYLETLICVVATAATSSVSIKDGGGSAISVLPAAVGSGIGTYKIPINAFSILGPWKVTTGAGVSVVAVGRFN